MRETAEGSLVELQLKSSRYQQSLMSETDLVSTTRGQASSQTLDPDLIARYRRRFVEMLRDDVMQPGPDHSHTVCFLNFPFSYCAYLA